MNSSDGDRAVTEAPVYGTEGVGGFAEPDALTRIGDAVACVAYFKLAVCIRFSGDPFLLRGHYKVA